ncbi:MAG: PEP-utilizing enzyme [Bacteriovorax sp.]|nr:PEP-utilizing enzyme [Bacteriovorax sp.]
MKYWTRQESKERFPKAITPLGWSLLHIPLEATLARMSETLGVKKYARNEMIIWENFTIYTRKNFFSDFKNLKFDYPRLFKLLYLAAASFFEVLYNSFSEKGAFKDKFANKLFYKIFGNDVDALIKRWPSQIEHLKNIMGRDYQLGEIKELDYESFLKIRRQMQEDSKLFFAEDFNVYFLKKLIFELLKSQLVSSGLKTKKAEETLATLSNGLKGNFSIKMIEDFNNPNLSIEELKKRYGHLTDNWDLYNPTFGEVESIWGHRVYSTLPEHQDINDQLENVTSLLAWNPLAPELIDWFQKLVLMDEDLRAYSSMQYPQARVLMSLVEKTAAWRELIIKKDSVYFLHLNEIEFGLKKSNFHLYFDLIHQRKNAFLEALKTNPPFDLIEATTGVFEPETILEKKDQDLKGSAVSSGSVQGIVTHINQYADLSKITKKSIIVLESATPVYAPFYALSGGIISETGGSLSHGAIVAREYGIPMLTGVENVCASLKEGQSIFLDADNEIIKVNI